MSRLKRAVFWQITLLPTYLFAVLALALASVFEAGFHGPYTSWVNQRLMARAEQAKLVGSPVSRIAIVLGPPDAVRRSWQVLDAAGGTATDAWASTTYEYYPYPWIPFSKFQVHTSDGLVRSVEMFDD